MKRIGILFIALLLCGFTAFAQDSSSASTSTSGTDTTDATTQQHKDAAVADENAAQTAKDKAKNAGTDAAEDHDKAIARLDDAGKVMHQLMAAPDTGIPQEVLDNAKCVAVIPSMLKGGFIFG